jgi:hypothetical protein
LLVRRGCTATFAQPVRSTHYGVGLDDKIVRLPR